MAELRALNNRMMALRGPAPAKRVLPEPEVAFGAEATLAARQRARRSELTKIDLFLAGLPGAQDTEAETPDTARLGRIGSE